MVGIPRDDSAAVVVPVRMEKRRIEARTRHTKSRPTLRSERGTRNTSVVDMGLSIASALTAHDDLVPVSPTRGVKYETYAPRWA